MSRKNPCNEQVLKGESLDCKLCNKTFTSKGALHYHIKNGVCIGIDRTSQQNIENVETLEQTNVNVEGDFKVDGDVKVVKFGEENLSYISDDPFKKIIGRGFKSLEEFMNHVHFNKDHPENHNIYVASLKDGHVVTYNGERWDVGIADQVLDDLIQQKSDILEDKYDELSDKLSPMESKKFNNFINRKDDEKVNLKLKRELRVQLYNNRHFAKGAKKLLEQREKLIENGIDIEPLGNDATDEDKLNQIINGMRELPSDKLDKVLNMLNQL
jgi:hypothetical protein